MLKLFLALTLALSTGVVYPDDPPVKAAKPEQEAVQIPYRLTDTKHILVRVKLNGKGPFNLILDTGAPAVFLTTKVAKSAGMETDKQGWAKTDTFEIEGGLKVKDAKTRVADLFQLEGMNGMGLAGVELHGVIGYNVLAQFRITYDFTADKLIWVPLDFTPPAVNAMGSSNSQGSMDVLGPAMKMLAGFMGIKPNFQTATRGLLGIEVNEVEGKIMIEVVFKDSQADKLGLKVGDQIIGYAPPQKGRKKAEYEPDDLSSLKALVKVMDRVEPGQEFALQILRGTVKKTVVITLGKGL